MKVEPKEIDQLLKDQEYKFLGWMNGWKHVYLDKDKNIVPAGSKDAKYFDYTTEDHPEYGKCRDAGHRHDEVSHSNRGSENTCSCDICKIYWKYDCSD